MTRKQQILSSLTKASLNAIAREHEVKGAFHMYTEDLVRVLSRMRSVRSEGHLEGHVSAGFEDHLSEHWNR